MYMGVCVRVGGVCVCVCVRVFTRERVRTCACVCCIMVLQFLSQSRMTLKWEFSMRAAEEFYNIPSVILCMSCLLNIV